MWMVHTTVVFLWDAKQTKGACDQVFALLAGLNKIKHTTSCECVVVRPSHGKPTPGYQGTMVNARQQCHRTAGHQTGVCERPQE